MSEAIYAFIPFILQYSQW